MTLDPPLLETAPETTDIKDSDICMRTSVAFSCVRPCVRPAAVAVRSTICARNVHTKGGERYLGLIFMYFRRKSVNIFCPRHLFSSGSSGVLRSRRCTAPPLRVTLGLVITAKMSARAHCGRAQAECLNSAAHPAEPPEVGVNMIAHSQIATASPTRGQRPELAAPWASSEYTDSLAVSGLTPGSRATASPRTAPSPACYRCLSRRHASGDCPFKHAMPVMK